MFKFTGRTGDVVGAKDMKGNIISRAYQPSVRNPQTLPQVTQRVKFLTATAISAAICKADSAGLVKYANQQRITERNALTKMLLDSGIITTPSSSVDEVRAEVDYEAMVIARGEGDYVSFGTPSFTEESEVSVTFSEASSSDLIHVVVYNDGSNEAAAAIAAGNLNSITVPVPTLWSGMRVHVYGFKLSFEDAEKAYLYQSYWTNRQVAAALATLRTAAAEAVSSRSQYIGTGTIA